MRTAALLVLLQSDAGSSLLAAPARVHRSATPLLRRAATPISIATLPDTAPVAPEDEWIAKLDVDAFKADIKALGERLSDGQGEEDVRHLQKIIRWSNICGAAGVLSCWMAPNPLTIVALSTWTLSRWTMIGHHVCHGGYNKQDDGTGRFTSHGFAVGSLVNRVRDWLDWMLPEAWNVEHNNLHHYRTGEPGDPDLVERNLVTLRDMRLPRPIKYAVVAVLAAIWKWYYYAPNTYKQLKIQEMKKKGLPPPSEEDIHAAFALPTFLDKGAPTEIARDRPRRRHHTTQAAHRHRCTPVCRAPRRAAPRRTPVLAAAGTAQKFDFSFLDYMKRVAGPYIAIRFFLMPVRRAAQRPAPTATLQTSRPPSRPPSRPLARPPVRCLDPCSTSACPPRCAGSAAAHQPRLLPQRAAQHCARRRRLEHPLVRRHRNQPRRQGPLPLRQLSRPEERILLHAPGERPPPPPPHFTRSSLTARRSADDETTQRTILNRERPADIS